MVQVEPITSGLVVKLSGAVDVSDVIVLRNQIAEMLDDLAGERVRVVVDLSEASHLGPRGLALLVDERALLVRQGGDLFLVGAAALAQLGLGPELHAILPLYPTVEEALAAA